MVESEILQLYELHYSDLVLLSSNHVSSSSEEIKRLESISATVMETLGPSGPGLLSITGVPNVSILRRTLLPLARNLSLLNHDDRKRLLKKHGLGSDVPLKDMDRSVSSFAMQLNYVRGMNLGQNGEIEIHEEDNNHNLKHDVLDIHRSGDLREDEFKNLGNTFKELGFCMIELGLCLARICDRAIGGQELEQSLLESGTAKGRLIHYHSALDNIILKESGRRNGSRKGQASYRRNKEDLERKPAEGSNLDTNEATSCQSALKLWQQWHYDYGVFTVLTDPLFTVPCDSQTTEAKEHCCLSCEQECPSTNGHTYLQIFDPNKNKVLMVKSLPKSFIIQVGESADILSKGKLRSTLHSVGRPENLANLSREIFVVFLQPAWSKKISLSDYPMEHLILGGQSSETCTEDSLHTEDKLCSVSQEIQNIVPPLSSRLKDGMTFAEFSRETTKQYYGGSGLQSKR